jgi:hypothetical protein
MQVCMAKSAGRSLRAQSQLVRFPEGLDALIQRRKRRLCDEVEKVL